MIFYFSGTGNTRWIAKQLAEAIDEEFIYIPDMIRESRYEFRLAESERIGFCFPTHGWQPPRIVRDFIKRIKITPPLESSNLYCWALTTCGDDIGETMTIFNKELEKKSLKAVALFSVIMPESYVCLPYMKTDTKERELEKITNAKRQIDCITQIIKDYRQSANMLVKGPTPRLYSYIIGEYFNKRMITDKKFMVDQDICIHCGKCVSICPVDNIEGIPPRWIHNKRCTLCLACYHHCPVHAINYGKITRKRGQYYFNRHEDQK